MGLWFDRRGLGGAVAAGLLAWVCCGQQVWGAAETSGTAWQLPPIRVVDESGKPEANALVAIVKKGKPATGFYVKETDGAGEVVFTRGDFFYPKATDPPVGTLQVMALVRGKAPEIEDWFLPTSAPLLMTAHAGKAVDIYLKPEDGRPVPADLTPMVFPTEYTISFFPKRNNVEVPPWPEQTGEGRYRVHLSEMSTSMALAINEPEFLIGFRQDFQTTEVMKAGKLQATLPRPGSVQIGISAAPGVLTTSSVEIASELQVMAELNESYGRSIRLSYTELDLGSHGTTYTIRNVAPGRRYSNLVRLTATEDMLFPDKEPQYSQWHSINVDAGETTTVEFLYREFSPELFKGEGTATFHFKRYDGVPAAGIVVSLWGYVQDFSGWYSVVKGPVDENGTTVIKNLSTDATYMLHKGWGDTQNLSGFISFDEGTSITQEIKLPVEVPEVRLKAGDPAPEATFFDLATSAPVKLSDFRGKVVFLDFWATWCGPCQGPMAHNESVMKKRGSEWGDKVVVLAASVEDDPEVVVAHVRKKGWNSMRHVLCGTREMGGGANLIYGVTGIPRGFLIDRQGKIVWTGHPEGFDLEREIENLLIR